MIILQELGTDQTFKFIPRSYTMTAMDITQEGVGSAVTYTTGGARVDYDGNTDAAGTYLSVTDTVSLKEGYYYSLVVKNGSAVIYKDRIFCTNQTLPYSVNDSTYTQTTSDNDFIIL